MEAGEKGGIVKRILRQALPVFMFAGILIFAGSTALATKEMNDKEKKSDPSVNCKTCHTGIPKTGDPDKKLNKKGECYKKTNDLKKCPEK